MIVSPGDKSGSKFRNGGVDRIAGRNHQDDGARGRHVAGQIGKAAMDREPAIEPTRRGLGPETFGDRGGAVGHMQGKTVVQDVERQRAAHGAKSVERQMCQSLAHRYLPIVIGALNSRFEHSKPL